VLSRVGQADRINVIESLKACLPFFSSAPSFGVATPHRLSRNFAGLRRCHLLQCCRMALRGTDDHGAWVRWLGRVFDQGRLDWVCSRKCLSAAHGLSVRPPPSEAMVQSYLTCGSACNNRLVGFARFFIFFLSTCTMVISIVFICS